MCSGRGLPISSSNASVSGSMRERCHAIEETHHSVLAADTKRRRSKMADSGHMLPALTWLPELQEWTLVNIDVRLEHRKRFALGMIDGMDRLCLMCPECQIPTAVLRAWIWCSHCGERLTQLAFSQQDPRYYQVDLHSGLQQRISRKPRAVLESSQKGGVESEPGDSLKEK